MDHCQAGITSEGVNDNVLKDTLGPEICSDGQKWTTVWLRKLPKKSMSMCRNFKTEDTLARNIFIRSNMAYRQADLTSEGVSDNV